MVALGSEADRLPVLPPDRAQEGKLDELGRAQEGKLNELKNAVTGQIRSVNRRSTNNTKSVTDLLGERGQSSCIMWHVTGGGGGATFLQRARV